jgi:hypothetical protein
MFAKHVFDKGLCGVNFIIAVTKYWTKATYMKERFILAHSFRGVRGCGEAEPLTSWKQRKGYTRNRPRQYIAPKDMPLVIYFVQLGPTFHHLPTMLSY